MSNRNNDVFSVLVTRGNQAALAAGNDISALAPGQIGVFDANTNISFGAATSPIPREFYFAVGIDRTGSTTLEDIRQSAGQLIQKKGITAYTFVPHSAGRPMIQKVGGYDAKCDTDYGVKVEFRNSRIYRIQGHNQYTKTYVTRTGCCDDCADGCDSYDSNNLTLLMVSEINSDIQSLLLAQPVARQEIDNAVVTTLSQSYLAEEVMSVVDVEALIAYNATQTDVADKFFTDFTITSVPILIGAWFQVNLGFHKFLETVIITSLVEGFACGGTVTTAQEVAFEEGSSSNIKDKEYMASGWAGSGPYVLSDVTGTARNTIEFLAVDGVKYDQAILEYFQKSESGWKEYENVLSTIFAYPATETTTRTSLMALLDAIVAGNGFEPLADDAAAASINPAVVEAPPANATKDGIG